MSKNADMRLWMSLPVIEPNVERPLPLHSGSRADRGSVNVVADKLKIISSWQA